MNKRIPLSCKTLGLPTTFYHLTARNGYENNWIHDQNLSPSILDDFVSNHKLEVPVREGALQVAEELYLDITAADGSHNVRMAQVSDFHFIVFGAINVT